MRAIYAMLTLRCLRRLRHYATAPYDAAPCHTQTAYATLAAVIIRHAADATRCYAAYAMACAL